VNANFAPSLAQVLLSEGGYSNDPQDPGGATMRGVTQAVYDDWRIEQGMPKRQVINIASDEIEDIYRDNYWSPCRCDDLPAGVDYAVFDFAVNSGVNRACRYLQRACSVSEDGVIGPMTLRAVSTLSAVALIDQLCDLRIGYLQGLPTFARFGRGWTARVSDVDAKAREMAA
jgi:lysozyme family protein